MYEIVVNNKVGLDHNSSHTKKSSADFFEGPLDYVNSISKLQHTILNSTSFLQSLKKHPIIKF